MTAMTRAEIADEIARDAVAVARLQVKGLAGRTHWLSDVTQEWRFGWPREREWSALVAEARTMIEQRAAERAASDPGRPMPEFW